MKRVNLKKVVGVLGVVTLLLSVGIYTIAMAEKPVQKQKQAQKEVTDAKTQKEVARLLAGMEKATKKGPWIKLTGTAAALRQIGKPAVPQLIEVFKDKTKSEIFRGMVCEVLTEILARRKGKKGGTAETAKPFIQVLEDKKETGYIRHHAAYTLGAIAGEAVIDPLVKALKDEDVSVQKTAALSLGHLKNKRATEALIMTLNDKNEVVRGNVARALGNIRDPRAVGPLVRALDDPDEIVAGQAAKALGRIKDPKTVTLLIKTLHKHKIEDDYRKYKKYEYVRENAAEALGEIGDRRAVEPLIKAMKRGNTAATKALGKIGDKRAVEPLIEALGQERLGAAKALGKIGDKRAIGPLRKSLEKGNIRAAEALAEMGDQGAVKFILKAVEKEKSPYERKQLKRAYKKLTGKEYKEEVKGKVSSER